jgi:SAM-dependent methyltransferase
VSSKSHWERVWANRAPEEQSWFQPRAEPSLRLIREAAVPAGAAIIDVGGGASRFVDDLLDAGYEDVTVLDLSATALAAARARLGARSARVRWWEADVLEAEFPGNAWDVWHDRAVFHFVTRAEDRRAYVRALAKAVRPGALVIIATFGEGGPEKCSGLPVVRYAPDTLRAELGDSFRLLRSEHEVHRTPGGREQEFLWCAFRYGPLGEA